MGKSTKTYANAYTAQFVIERDKLYTKNSNLPHGLGIIPIENVPELQVGGNVNSETSRVPKSAEDTKLEKLDGQQLQVYNYVLANEAITTKEAKVLLGLQDGRERLVLGQSLFVLAV